MVYNARPGNARQEIVTSMRRQMIPEEQFLHHQLGLKLQPGTGSMNYVPAGSGWSEDDHIRLLTAMGDGKTWTMTIVDELVHAGVLPIVYANQSYGYLGQKYVVEMAKERHDEDPDVFWEIQITVPTEEGAEDDGEEVGFCCRTRKSELTKRNQLVRDQFKEEYPDDDLDFGLIAEDAWEALPVALENRYDRWMARFQPIPVYGFDNEGKPLDVQIDVSTSKIPLGIDEHHIWTRVWADNAEVIVPGYHHVNRLAYIVTKHPWTDADADIEVID